MSSQIDQLEEYAKCAASKWHFIMHYCLMNVPDKGATPFTDWLHQKQLIPIIEANNRLIILKARQLGISWFVCAIVLWYMTFVPGARVGLFSRREPDASDLLRNRVRFMWSHLPDFLRLSLDKDSDVLLTFPDNLSAVHAFPSDPDAGSSYTFSLVILDEMAKMENARDLLTAVLPTVEHGKLIGLSSARGMKNTFAETYWKARRGENQFVPIFIPYNVVPGRTKQWWANTTKDFPGWLAFQEYPKTETEAFLTAGTCLFDLKKLEAMPVEPPSEVYDDISIYRDYNDTHKYVFGLDTALGVENRDFICGQMIDETAGEVAAKFRTRMPIEEIDEPLHNLLLRYGSPQIIIEEQPHGRMVVKGLRALGYPLSRIYHRAKGRPCFHTGAANRAQILTQIAIAVRTEVLTIFSEETIDEFKGFGWNEDKERFESLTGNDDEVMSMALAYELIEHSSLPFQNTEPISYIGRAPNEIVDVNWAKSDPMKGIEIVVCPTCEREGIVFNPTTQSYDVCTACRGLGSYGRKVHV